MTLASRYLASTISAFALFVVYTTPITSALIARDDVFLDASAAPLQGVDITASFDSKLFSTSSETQAIPETSRKGDAEEGGLVWDKVKSLFTAWGLFSGSMVLSDDSLSSEDFTANVRISEVKDTSATVTWSPSVFSNVKVYYASASPVVVSDETASVSPWKPWNRSEVTLKGLSPNTIYFYKVVAETPSRKIVSAEASFKTVTD